ncbi:MAG: ATP-binding protein [Pyrinomonadaceae bacterium]|nr:ATP-binding protein [Pyrinomonadaceae bacterium]
MREVLLFVLFDLILNNNCYFCDFFTKAALIKPMLIDFTVENFRSIKEPVTLSAIAQTHKKNTSDDKITKPFSFPKRKLEILPVLGIFGANASGKSNVLNALNHLLTFVFYSSNYDKFSAYPEFNFVKPFLLTSSTSKVPTRFTLRILREGNIYIYNLSLHQNVILEEKLEYIPQELEKAYTRLIFNRIWNNRSQSYDVENGKEFGEAYREIQKSLKESQAFLGFLLLNVKNEFLRLMLIWLGSYWNSNSLDKDVFDHTFSCALIEDFKSNYPELKNKVSEIMKKFDVGIEDVEIKKLKNESGEDYEVRVIHKTDKGTVKWLLEEESLGTKKLFTLATKLFFTFESGTLMLVDELGASTHPNINREIIKLFQNKKINKNNGQLIFTSHDSSLLGKGILRRDQIYYTNKKDDGSTELYSLSDFGIRNDLSIEKAYLDGRFKAVPFLPSERELEELAGVN